MNHYNIIFPESISPQHLNYLLDIGSVPIVIVKNIKNTYVFLTKYDAEIIDPMFNVCISMRLCTEKEKEDFIRNKIVPYRFIYHALSSISDKNFIYK